MTADEIRKEQPDLGDERDLFYMFREIAAQLAELNANLKSLREVVVERS